MCVCVFMSTYFVAAILKQTRASVSRAKLLIASCNHGCWCIYRAQELD